MMGRDENDDEPVIIAPITSASLHQTSRYASTERNGPTADNFELFLDTRSLKDRPKEIRLQVNRWNEKAATVFTEDFMSYHDQYKDANKIKKAFLTHLITLFAQYYKYLAQGTPLTAAEIQCKKQLSAKRWCNIRHERHAQVCHLFEQDPVMKCFEDLFRNQLPWQACSGDESDERRLDRALRITKLPWHAKRIQDWMETLDRLHVALRLNDNGRPATGKWPRLRVDPELGDPPVVLMECFKDSPVKGLPPNFYNQRWLRTLTALEVNRLEIREPLDNPFPDYILKRAEQGT
ncbi:hypothetical protein EST38_g10376 [Candolleomyces aberdarensis]|uniref:Uncharacterized protein n=1 Tax=Candolleomyces aberdarensis TaxID=2316362 RepID=A0A4Q2D967_9AGAR|nr:hypothetical protein EST38_g10376 [Candolleomyces aberdarensis]